MIYNHKSAFHKLNFFEAPDSTSGVFYILV